MIKEELKIRPDIKGGIHPGAFAGFAGGTAVFVCNFLFYNKELWPKYSTDVVFLLGQFGTHAFFNMIWGAVFGILFVMFYEKIPREGIPKAIIYGMIIFLLFLYLAVKILFAGQKVTSKKVLDIMLLSTTPKKGGFKPYQMPLKKKSKRKKSLSN